MPYRIQGSIFQAMPFGQMVKDMQFSTGLRNGMMNGSGAKDQLDLGFIIVLNGAIPATANAAQTGTALWTISVDGDGTGLTWEVNTTDVTIQKPSAAVWQGATTAGTGTYFRIVGASDTGASSTSEPRIQGTVGTGATNDMVMANITFTTDAALDARVLGAASIALPTL